MTGSKHVGTASYYDTRYMSTPASKAWYKNLDDVKVDFGSFHALLSSINEFISCSQSAFGSPEPFSSHLDLAYCRKKQSHISILHLTHMHTVHTAHT
jgi:hypothetical protein